MQLIQVFKKIRQRGAINSLKDRYWSAHRGITYLRAQFHRRQLRNTRFIGITGSAGKTLTKELSNTILSAFEACKASPFSENEHPFIASTLLETQPSHRYCVVEMAGHQPGYMDRSIQMLKPDIGVLTLIGHDHYKSFKSLEGIAKEKGKLISSLPEEGVAVLNIDDPLVKAIGEDCKCRVIWVGKAESATIRLLTATSLWPEPLKLAIESEGKTYEILTQLHGTHLALSILLALGVGLAAGIPLEKSISALTRATPTEGRMQIVADGTGVTFIRDDWKAPHWSLPAPLEFLKNARSKRKIAIFGTISDMSGDSSGKYKKLAKDISEYAQLAIFVGPNAYRALRTKKRENSDLLKGFSNIRDAALYLQDELREGDLVLLKGSAKADHLVRLILNRIQPIQCWQDRCGLNMFCGGCSFLYQTSQDNPAGIAPKKTRIKLESLLSSSSASLNTDPVIPVIAGLGNPGNEFQSTPHNVGYHLLDLLAKRFDGHWQSTEEGLASLIIIDDKTVKLFKPAANMNVSGPVLRQFLDKNGCAAEHCTIIHDDMDIELGKIRFKRDGGDAGHRGVRSVIMALGTDAVHRVRIGVRRPGDQRKATKIVLSHLTPEEISIVTPAIEQAIELIRTNLGTSKTKNNQGDIEGAPH